MAGQMDPGCLLACCRNVRRGRRRIAWPAPCLVLWSAVFPLRQSRQGDMNGAHHYQVVFSPRSEKARPGLKQNVVRLAVSVTAAYALVLHLLFASALMASMPRGAWQICFGLQSSETGPLSGAAAAHCPDCITRDQLAPAPASPPLAARASPRCATYVSAASVSAPPVAWRQPWQPRAPPIPA